MMQGIGVAIGEAMIQYARSRIIIFTPFDYHVTTFEVLSKALVASIAESGAYGAKDFGEGSPAVTTAARVTALGLAG
jgi:hypothetical protein